MHNLINKDMINVNIIDDIYEGELMYATTAGDDIHYIETLND